MLGYKSSELRYRPRYGTSSLVVIEIGPGPTLYMHHRRDCILRGFAIARVAGP